MWNYQRHLHPLQAANCCRNSRLVVYEDDLKWMTNENKIGLLLLLKQFHRNVRRETPRFYKIRSYFRYAKWCLDASWVSKGEIYCVCYHGKSVVWYQITVFISIPTRWKWRRKQNWIITDYLCIDSINNEFLQILNYIKLNKLPFLCHGTKLGAQRDKCVSYRTKITH